MPLKIQISPNCSATMRPGVGQSGARRPCTRFGPAEDEAGVAVPRPPQGNSQNVNPDSDTRGGWLRITLLAVLAARVRRNKSGPRRSLVPAVL